MKSSQRWSQFFNYAWTMLSFRNTSFLNAVLYSLLDLLFCPKKAGSAKKAKKKSKAKGGEDSPAADDAATKADEPVPLKKQKKAKASDEELDAKKVEVNRRKEQSKAAIEANKKKQTQTQTPKSAAKKAAAVEAPKKGAKMSEEEAKALFDKAQQRNKQAAAPAVQTSRGGRFAAFGDDSD